MNANVNVNASASAGGSANVNAGVASPKLEGRLAISSSLLQSYFP